MPGAEDLELLHAEIDGELGERDRARLSQALLADPMLRARREELRRLAAALDGTPAVEPPKGLADAIIAALPQAHGRVLPSQRSISTWRQAAVVATLLIAGAVIYAVVDSRAPPSNEVAGTLAGARAPIVLDGVQLADGPVRGRVQLTASGTGMSLELDVSAAVPVEVLVTRAGARLQTVELAEGGAAALIVSLPGSAADARPVDLSFRVAGREVGRATLRAGAAR